MRPGPGCMGQVVGSKRLIAVLALFACRATPEATRGVCLKVRSARVRNRLKVKVFAGQIPKFEMR